jgi:formylglycine-generating enzyme required for sulfatase activity|nr:SUMF1/EgtB/PvdO family nonheme iron enzyme [Kofleriaceae bacterium]
MPDLHARAGSLVVALTVGASCGRIGFDRTSDGGGGDGSNRAGGPRSCAALPASCGPSGSESCCASPIVPAVTFDRSFDLGSDAAFDDMTHPATVAAFRLDRFEITVGRFRAFVLAGAGTQLSPPAVGDGAHAQIANSGWQSRWDANLAATTAKLETALSCNGNATWSATPGSNDTLPINCIDWYEAEAFCAWDGGFLPTEAEWNAAAAGGSDQRPFPWSAPATSLTVDCAHANYEPMQNMPCSGSGSGVVSALPVGSTSPAGDGAFGQADLAGNVWELVLDQAVTPYELPCVDCAVLAGSDGTPRELRGGGAHDSAASLRSGVRTGISASDRAAHVNQGARCARAM